MTDAWKMASKTPEVPNDPSRHCPLKRRFLLARLLLAADATWLAEKALVVEALKTSLVFRKAEFYRPLREDKTRMWQCGNAGASLAFVCLLFVLVLSRNNLGFRRHDGHAQSNAACYGPRRAASLGETPRLFRPGVALVGL